MYSTYSLREALRFGTKKGYILFPEARQEENIKKAKDNAVLKQTINELKEYVSEEKGSYIPITFKMFMEFQKTGNRLIYEDAYFERRKQLFSEVLLYLVEKNDILIESIEEKLWQWCDMYSWELPAHIPLSVEAIEKAGIETDIAMGLFSAETGFFFAEILSLMGDKLDKLLIHRIKKEIFRRVINSYKENTFFWEGAKMNWSAVCAGSVGAAAIYLIEDENELCVILQRVLCSLETYIEGFDKDGLITEGLAYWNYGLSFYLYFAELLKDRTGGKISILENNEKLRKIAELPAVLQFPSEHFVTFSDSGAETWRGDYGMLAKLGQELNIKDYTYPGSESVFSDNTYRWAAMPRKLFWGILSEPKEKAAVKTGMKYFGESQWLIDRRISGSGSFVAFAAKGGHNDEPHNHNDLGSFMLHYNGENVLADIGSAEYVKQYFQNDTRYKFLLASSLGHSIPVINDCVQKQGQSYKAEVINCEKKDCEVNFKLDLKGAYECSSLEVYTREFIWKPDSLELMIRDTYGFNKAKNLIEEVFITEAEPKVLEPGRVSFNFKNCAVELLFPEKLEFSAKKESYRDHFGREAVLFRNCFIANDVSDSAAFNFKIRIAARS